MKNGSEHYDLDNNYPYRGEDARPQFSERNSTGFYGYADYPHNQERLASRQNSYVHPMSKHTPSSVYSDNRQMRHVDDTYRQKDNYFKPSNAHSTHREVEPEFNNHAQRDHRNRYGNSTSNEYRTPFKSFGRVQGKDFVTPNSYVTECQPSYMPRQQQDGRISQVQYQPSCVSRHQHEGRMSEVGYHRTNSRTSKEYPREFQPFQHSDNVTSMSSASTAFDTHFAKAHQNHIKDNVASLSSASTAFDPHFAKAHQGHCDNFCTPRSKRTPQTQRPLISSFFKGSGKSPMAQTPFVTSHKISKNVNTNELFRNAPVFSPARSFSHEREDKSRFQSSQTSGVRHYPRMTSPRSATGRSATGKDGLTAKSVSETSRSLKADVQQKPFINPAAGIMDKNFGIAQHVRLKANMSASKTVQSNLKPTDKHKKSYLVPLPNSMNTGVTWAYIPLPNNMLSSNETEFLERRTLICFIHQFLSLMFKSVLNNENRIVGEHVLRVTLDGKEELLQVPPIIKQLLSDGVKITELNLPRTMCTMRKKRQGFLIFIKVEEAEHERIIKKAFEEKGFKISNAPDTAPVPKSKEKENEKAKQKEIHGKEKRAKENKEVAESNSLLAK